jgi:hypothetical protein
MNSTILVLATMAIAGVFFAFVIAEPMAYADPHPNQGQCFKQGGISKQECKDRFQNNP